MSCILSIHALGRERSTASEGTAVMEMFEWRPGLSRPGIGGSEESALGGKVISAPGACPPGTGSTATRNESGAIEWQCLEQETRAS